MCNEDVARAALRAIGIPFPSQGLIRSWIQVARGQKQLRESAKSQGPNVAPPITQYATRASSGQIGPREPRHGRGYSKSRLEQALREHGTLRRQHGPRKPGRPRIVASWFPAVARAWRTAPPYGTRFGSTASPWRSARSAPLPQRGIQEALPRRASSVPAISTSRNGDP